MTGYPSHQQFLQLKKQPTIPYFKHWQKYSELFDVWSAGLGPKVRCGSGVMCKEYLYCQVAERCSRLICIPEASNSNPLACFYLAYWFSQLGFSHICFGLIREA